MGVEQQHGCPGIYLGVARRGLWNGRFMLELIDNIPK
jgi:hypothetical protein